MSRRFLTPVNLPSGVALPSVGSAGDLFYKLGENAIYVHNGTTWAISQSGPNAGGSLDDLDNVSISTPLSGDILLYNSSNSLWEATPLGQVLYSEESAAWHRNNMLQVLLETGLVTTDGGSYNTTTFAGTMDGGAYNTPAFSVGYDGGSAGSI